MRSTTVLIIVILYFGLSVLFALPFNLLSPAFAAPIPRTGPITLEGTIENLTWSPGITCEGMPGMSFTLGQERTFPARYVVDLRDISILDSTGGYGLAVDFDKGRATLLLVHPADDQLLKKGMRIRVSGNYLKIGQSSPVTSLTSSIYHSRGCFSTTSKGLWEPASHHRMQSHQLATK